MGFNPDEYTTVDERLEMYREDYPDYRVRTKVTFRSQDGERITMKAAIYKNLEEQRENMFHATGIASETYEGYVNETSRDENCETSAIGRALANAGYTGKGGRPSKEEMEKVKRIQEARGNKPKAQPSKTENEEVNDKPKKNKISNSSKSTKSEPNKDNSKADEQEKSSSSSNRKADPDEFIENCDNMEELISWWKDNKAEYGDTHKQKVAERLDEIQ